MSLPLHDHHGHGRNPEVPRVSRAEIRRVTALVLFTCLSLAVPMPASAGETDAGKPGDQAATPNRTYLPPDVLRELEGVATTPATTVERRPEPPARPADGGAAGVAAGESGDAIAVTSQTRP